MASGGEASAAWLSPVASLLVVGCSFQLNGASVNDGAPPITHVPAVPAVSATPAVPAAESARSAQRFVVIGDYGASGADEAKIANLARGLKPDFIITTGDNNYPLGEAETIDENVGLYFHDFIAPYRGAFGTGASENRFFPCLGNHDWYTFGAKPYLDFFSLPNNERYYDFVRGPVQLFALDSDPIEPDGTEFTSVQGHWLEQRLLASTVPWRVVYFHHSPYSSGPHGPTLGMRWPFQKWGATLVYSGHDHTYERFAVDGFPYIVNGAGGSELYEFTDPAPGSVVRVGDVHGLVLVTVTETELVSRFLDARGVELDALRLTR